MAMAAPSAEAPRGRKRGAEGPPALPHEEVQDQARAWTEVFTLFQQSGRDDRGAAFAMSMGALRRRGEEIDSIDRQIEALRFAAGRLQQHARCEAAGPGGAPSVTPQAQAWGRALAGSLGEKVRQVAAAEAAEEPPWRAAVLADEAHAEALRLLAGKRGAEGEADAQAGAESDAVVREREDRWIGPSATCCAPAASTPAACRFGQGYRRAGASCERESAARGAAAGGTTRRRTSTRRATPCGQARRRARPTAARSAASSGRSAPSTTRSPRRRWRTCPARCRSRWRGRQRSSSSRSCCCTCSCCRSWAACRTPRL
ncbi:unnamed protein product [Prorocentrum cordatum]|uniref:Uncharacterized protein n=1 Tax=Prorocentrum cordatum TaxID=2364126 RepID=A0ABN9W5Q0_9DINO|nr:unnamed protein product [Polarella glacialis]